MSESEKYQVIFSGVVAISTVVYSLLTWKLVSETRIMREFQTAPDLNIHIKPGEADASLIFIIFDNLGMGPATDVQFSIKQGLEKYDDDFNRLENIGIVENGIKNFYPNQSFRYYLTNLSLDSKSKKDSKIIIEAKYRSITGRKFSRVFSISMLDVRGQSTFSPPETYLGRISYELGEIKKLLKKASNS